MAERKKCLFIDRDGTLIREYPPTYQIDHFDKVSFYPFVFKYLGKIASELDFELVMVTNQDGLGTDKFREEDFWPAHNLIMSSFANEGILFREVLIDRSYPEENLSTRKPGTGMFKQYLNSYDFDIAGSFVIGDRITDVQLAKNLGCKAIWLKNDPGLGSAEISDDSKILEKAIAMATKNWKDIYLFLKAL